MKKNLTTFILLLLLMGIMNPTVAQVRIMPLGDSITQGHTSGVDILEDEIAYRKTLWDSLQANQYNVDFVGNELNGQSYAGFDANHEGHFGWKDNQVADSVYGWLTTAPADIILLHIGTNDPEPDSIQHVAAILDEIDRYDEDIIVVVAKIIQRNCYFDNPKCQPGRKTATVNDNVADLVQSRKNAGDILYLVDMEEGAGMDYNFAADGGDMFNDIHPAVSGYNKMANVWFEILKTILVSPAITSIEETQALVGVPYTYTASAGGSGVIYTLDSAPAGMTIDSESGVISWTPSSNGNENVTVTATSAIGSDSQSFTITVSDLLCFDSGVANLYMELDNLMFDERAYNNDGEVAPTLNAPTVISGKVQSALQFNGIDTGVNIPVHDSYNWGANDSFTIEYWVKRNGNPSGTEVVVGRDDAASKLHWWSGLKNTGNVTFTLRSTTNEGADSDLTSSSVITDGTWHHIVAVRDNENNQNLLYVDGVLEASASVNYTNGFNSGTSPINLGFLNLGAGFLTSSAIDEFSIYSTALSPYQIGLRAIVVDNGQENCVNGIPASNEDQFTNNLPATYRLNGLYPNPFTNTVNYEFTIEQTQHVQVSVFDVLGRQVAMLYDGTMFAGENNQLTFDGTNLPAGLYIIHTEGENFAETQKVLHLD